MIVIISDAQKIEYHLKNPTLERFKELSDYIYEDIDWRDRYFEIIYEGKEDWIFQSGMKTVIGFLENIGHIKEWNTLIKVHFHLDVGRH